MAHEICLVAADDPAEVRKVQKNFPARFAMKSGKNTIEKTYTIVQVDFDVAQTVYLSQSHKKKYKTNTSTIADKTFTAILVAVREHGIPAHVRWFGHGNRGCLIGAEKTLLSLESLARIIAVTRTPIFSIYSCLTGGPLGEVDPIEGYRVDNVPMAIFGYCLTLMGASQENQLVINTNYTLNMWGEATAHVDFAGDRHSHFNGVNSMRELRVGEAAKLNLTAPEALNARAMLASKAEHREVDAREAELVDPEPCAASSSSAPPRRLSVGSASASAASNLPSSNSAQGNVANSSSAPESPSMPSSMEPH